jgi:2,4-dienoyl-CoA reductase-like NADH-dependent reductase (Old Yellow Enzyme family)
MSDARPILFSPLALRDLTLKNRVVTSPMDMYMAENGFPVDFHRTHYGKFAMGGAGLVIVEASGVTREGRITNGCMGVWSDAHAEALAPIAAEIKAHGAAAALQIGHGGRKASAQRAWEGNGPLTAENLANGDESWEPIGPSPEPFAEGWLRPRPMARADMEAVRDAFAAAAARAARAGFDAVELHMAHGYLLQSFLSPLANRRNDAFGGARENRMRFPLEVVEAVRAALPGGMPLFARISATDFVEGGWDIEDSVVLARELEARGVDVVDCSGGGNLVKGATNANLSRGPGYQAPFAERIRAETGLKTQAVGLIRNGTFAEALLQKGAADLIAVGRQMLWDPFWALHAAEELGATDAEFSDWPEPYGWWLKQWAKGLKGQGETLEG